MKIVLTKETKSSFRLFDDIFQFFHLAGVAADWKLVRAGGGVKKTKHFCTLGPVQSDYVHEPNEELCQ
jgi:hypothetical protein